MTGKKTTVLQLRDDVLTLISRRGLDVGGQIPTESELVTIFGASRPTIREALKLLEQSGTIRVKHGRGRYLTPAGTVRIDRPITEFESLTEMAGHLGYSLENKVVSVAEEEASANIASRLSLDADRAVIRLERIRLNKGLPVVYCLEFIRRSAIPKKIFDVDWSGSLLDLLGSFGQRPVVASARVDAVLLPEDVVRRNGLVDFGPALLIEETAIPSSGVPVLHAQNYHKGGQFGFSLLRK